VGYQKFLPWVAKAYLKSGECFEKLGKKEEAVRTYQEMLRNEKLAPFEETSAARKRLQELGGGAAS
jgi:TolA-binding protein